MKRCDNYGKNMDGCPCTYEPCGRKGVCCECLRYHLGNDELPACYFSKEAERTYDRSVEHFIMTRKKGSA